MRGLLKAARLPSQLTIGPEPQRYSFVLPAASVERLAQCYPSPAASECSACADAGFDREENPASFESLEALQKARDTQRLEPMQWRDYGETEIWQLNGRQADGSGGVEVTTWRSNQNSSA